MKQIYRLDLIRGDNQGKAFEPKDNQNYALPWQHVKASLTAQGLLSRKLYIIQMQGRKVFMPVLVVLTVAVQILTAIHVVRSGRDTFWIIFIMMAPWIGSLVYFVSQVLPEMRHSKAAQRVKTDVGRLIDPDKGLREAAMGLEDLDTHANRVRLADECMARGQFDEAIPLLEGALTGIYEHHPATLLRISRAEFERRHYTDALAALDRLQANNQDFKSEDGHLLYARSLEELARTEEALDAYKALADYAGGEEARVRFALLLQKIGRVDEARTQFAETVRRVDKASKVYYRSQKDWYQTAKRNL